MNPKRRRIAAVFVALAALLALAILIIPVIEVDTGPGYVLALVSHPAAVVLSAVFVDMVDQADALNVYFAEDESLVEITTTLVLPAEVARYESGRSSGVGERCLDAFSSYDLMRVRHWATHPLRC